MEPQDEKTGRSLGSLYCLKYLAVNARRRIKFRGYEEDKACGRVRNKLWGWVDAGFAAGLDTRMSHSGYVIMLKGGAVSWTSCKSVSISTAESEWYEASESGKEVVHVRIIMEQFGFPPTGATQLFEDSRAVHCIPENPVNRMASRHIDTRKHSIGELVENRIVKLTHCKTDKMAADALTKNLPGPAFEVYRSRMMGECVEPFHVCMSGGVDRDVS